MSNLDLTSTFNHSGKKFETEKVLVAADIEKPPRKGIIFHEDVTFAFKSGDYTAPQGSIPYINPDDPDGCTVKNFSVSPNTAQRVACRKKSIKPDF